MSSQAEIDTGNAIRRLRAVDVPARLGRRAQLPLGMRMADTVKMLVAGLVLGSMVVAATKDWGLVGSSAHAARPASPPHARADADPYREARHSREILEAQAGAPR
jgi:hypothetical protein